MLISELEKMSDEKLVELTEEDIERIVMFNIADLGVPIELEPQYEVLNNIKQPLNKFYETELFENLLFPNADSVEAMSKLARDLGVVRKATYYKYNSNPIFVDLKHGACDDEPREKPVKLFMCYSLEEYKIMADELAENKRIDTANKAKQAKYDKYLTAKRNLQYTIQNIIDDAARSIWHKKQEEEKFKTYLQIAKGDYDMAMAFYMKANSNDPDLKKHIDSVYCKQVYEVIETPPTVTE
jgi:hypothetical protein